MHPGWHDKKENQIGKITGLLSTDIESLKNLNGIQVASIFTSIVGFVISMIIAFWASWRLTLTIIIIIPVAGGAFYKVF